MTNFSMFGNVQMRKNTLSKCDNIYVCSRLAMLLGEGSSSQTTRTTPERMPTAAPPKKMTPRRMPTEAPPKKMTPKRKLPVG